MPGYKTHLCGGIFSFVILLALLTSPYTFSSAVNLPTTQIILYLLCACAGSLFPDIDIKSKGQWYFYCFFAILLCIVIWQHDWYTLSWASVVGLMPLLVHHRGITHQVWFILSAPCSVLLYIHYRAPVYLDTAWLGYLFFVAGALSHVVLDFGIRNFLRRGLFGWPKIKRRKKH